MISDAENSDSTDSENDINEIEAMLYSQIHHSNSRYSDEEILNKSPNEESLPISLLKDKSASCACLSTVNASGRATQTTLVNKDNVLRATNEEVIILSSDDECEILDSCGTVSKYNYHGLKEASTTIQKSITSRSSIESENASKIVDSSTSSIGGTKCLTNLYIHIDGDVSQMDAEEIDIGSDTDVESISSLDYDVSSDRKRKREDVAKMSPRKKQNTANDLSRHATEDEDCIVEIPVPVRKGDEWFICEGDRYNKSPNRRKDFHRRQLHIVCYNCNQRGHITKTCPAPITKIRCYICGDTGHHGDRCYRATCSVCWESGHSSISCKGRKNIPYRNCSVCKIPGHMDEHCPDFWRRYHLTLNPGKLVVSTALLKSRDAISCCNCGQKGHFVHECRGKRMDCFVLPNRPDVVSYNSSLNAPSNSNMSPQNSNNTNAFRAFGKFKQWHKNIKQEARQAVSSVKQNIGQHIRFTNNFTPKYNRKRWLFKRNSSYDVERTQNAQQVAEHVTNGRPKRKFFKKFNRRNFNRQNFTRLGEMNY